MRKQGGFTLIEILVTVVVLAIGLLGLAGLQATALSFNSTAYQRSQATSLAYDIIDRMRANVTAARNGQYNVNFGFANPGAGTLAQRDLGEWRQAMINTLPSGTGCISQTGNVFRIAVGWDDSRGQDASQPHPPCGNAVRTFQTDTEL